MHARPRVTPYAPQSRDRLYLAYWATSLGRDPDWNRWLRPSAWCPSCEKEVAAVQWWKRAGNDMGRYRQQYLYRCPHVACRGQVVEPTAMPAAAAIDWSLRGQRIGDRDVPLKPKTIARIEAGLKRYARPITMEAAGNTYERRPGVRTWPVDAPLTTLTTTQTKALACPPLMVPAGGTWRDEPTPVTDPMAARTTRENDGLAVPPFLTINRGGEDDLRTATLEKPLASLTASSQPFGLVTPPFIAVLRNRQDATAITEPIGTVSTMGAHHALIEPAGMAMVMRNNGSRGDGGEHCTPAAEPLRTLTSGGHQSLLTWDHLAHLLVPYYGTGVAQPVAEPAGTMTTVDRFGLASPAVAVEDVLFRMLEPGEIGAAMAFAADYQVLGSKREKVRQYGNAVTPPVAEVLVSALAECITGEEIAA
jgi:DNA (cytosine-5)-methyltransferase 1